MLGHRHVEVLEHLGRIDLHGQVLVDHRHVREVDLLGRLLVGLRGGGHRADERLVTGEILRDLLRGRLARTQTLLDPRARTAGLDLLRLASKVCHRRPGGHEHAGHEDEEQDDAGQDRPQ